MEGVDRGAAAIRDFTNVADRFTDIVQELPGSVHWELQLFLLDIAKNPLVGTFLENWTVFIQNTSRLAATAEKLPERMGQEASKLLDQIDAKQANLQATLREAEKTAAIVERSLARVDVVAASIDKTAVSVADAGRAWDATARTIGQTVRDISGEKAKTTATQPVAGPTGGATPGANPSESPGVPGTTFDINDYWRTADALTGTAEQVRLLTQEVRALLESRQLAEQIRDVDDRVAGTVDRMSMRAEGVMDHLIWRTGQLAVFLFVLAIVYRVLATRALKRGT